MSKKIEDPKQFNIAFPENNPAAPEVDNDNDGEDDDEKREEEMIQQTLNREEWEAKQRDMELEDMAEAVAETEKVRQEIKQVSSNETVDNDNDDDEDSKDNFNDEYYGRFSKFKKVS
jgi:hypothetical protein